MKDTSTAVAGMYADVLGMALKRNSIDPADKCTVPGPMGLKIPLEMRFSHGYGGRSKSGFCARSYKVAGQLYITVVLENCNIKPSVSVVLLDKGRWLKTHRGNFASMITEAKQKGDVDSLEEYLEVVKDAVVGVWHKGDPFSTTYRRMKLD